MSQLMQMARGASTYSTFARSLSGPLDEAAYFAAVAARIPTMTWARLIDELLRIRNYRDDWDGEGTVALSSTLVDGAITLAQHLRSLNMAPADRVTAGVNGTVTFEWHTAEGYREVEVTSPIDAESRWVPHGSMRTEVFSLSRRT